MWMYYFDRFTSSYLKLCLLLSSNLFLVQALVIEILKNVLHCNQVFSLCICFEYQYLKSEKCVTSIPPFNLFVVVVRLENKYLKKFSDNFFLILHIKNESLNTPNVFK